MHIVKVPRRLFWLPDAAGNAISLDETVTRQLNDTIENFASEPLRTLCLAYMDIENSFSTAEQMPLNGYTCIRIVGITDPV